MRNTLLGAALAIVLVVALFAAAHYGRKPSEAAAPALSADEIAAAIPSDFIGEQAIGPWKLLCNKAQELPRPPNDGRTGNSAGAPPREAPPPPGWKLPRCFVTLGLRNPKSPDDEIRVTFRTMGFKRVLSMFLKFPPDYMTNGDIVRARFDTTEWQIPIRTCARRFCLAIQSVKFVDVPVVEKAHSFALAFKPQAGATEIMLPIPTEGMTAAIRTMRRLNG